LSRSLALLAGERRVRRRIAILGEMLELGDASPDLHRTLGAEAARAGASHLIAVGGAAAQALAEGALESAMPPQAVHYLPDSTAAADLAVRLVEPGDLVLVKGSRGIRTERVVERLKAEFA
jgi:UDP-N-acetylmuramoyl-tripeptide--D-alanyl-D-alanine ligase